MEGLNITVRGLGPAWPKVFDFQFDFNFCLFYLNFLKFLWIHFYRTGLT